MSNIAILTSKDNWFEPYAQKLMDQLSGMGYHPELFYHSKDIPDSYEIVFMLCYYRIVPGGDLNRHKHNLVIHASDLPKGKGWAPLFWQVLEGRDEIPVVMFDATEEMDAGRIYIKDYIKLDGKELHDEIRHKQAEKFIEMVLKFLDEYDSLTPYDQSGEETLYERRTPVDSELDINKSIADQIHLLRIVSNKDFPAFFYYKGQKYTLQIHKDENDQ